MEPCGEPLAISVVLSPQSINEQKLFLQHIHITRYRFSLEIYTQEEGETEGIERKVFMDTEKGNCRGRMVTAHQAFSIATVWIDQSIKETQFMLKHHVGAHG